MSERGHLQTDKTLAESLAEGVAQGAGRLAFGQASSMARIAGLAGDVLQVDSIDLEKCTGHDARFCALGARGRHH